MATDTIRFDFHSHILPGADHGASSREESLSILRAAADVGIRRIAATPHFYPHKHHVDRFLERRDAAYARIEAESGQNGLPLIIPGAEVLLCPGIDRMPGLSRLCLSGTRLLLLELPFVVAEHTEDMYETIERLIFDRGFTVFIAHPNRYPSSTIDRVLEMDVYLQLNLEDVYSLRERMRIRKWIENGRVHAVGSDIHHSTDIYKKLPKAAKILQDALPLINHPWRAGKPLE